MGSNLTFRDIEVEVSSDNLASALVDLFRRIAPGLIKDEEEIAMIEFKERFDEVDYDGSFNLALTLRTRK